MTDTWRNVGVQALRLAELRALCGELRISQRGVARMLEMDEDDFRHMCTGHQPVTLSVLYATRYLLKLCTETPRHG